MKKSMHINECIPVAIAHVKKQQKNIENKGVNLFTNIHQSMLKLKTHSGSHDLFRF